MFRLIFFLSLFPIAAALAARWWFGIRVLTSEGNRPCRCDLKTWMPAPGDDAVIHRAEAPAGEFGRQLRHKALAEWQERDRKAFISREKTRRFGLAVPPLSAAIAILAVVVGRVPPAGALAIPLAATAMAAVLDLLSLPSELAAISRGIRKARQDGSFPARDDEETVARCANAHAWNVALPPLLRWVQR